MLAEVTGLAWSKERQWESQDELFLELDLNCPPILRVAAGNCNGRRRNGNRRKNEWQGLELLWIHLAACL